jgi:hypothetical protein
MFPAMKVEVQIYSGNKNNQGHVYRNCLQFPPQDMVFMGSSLILTREKQIRILTVENPSKMQQCIKILLFLILNETQHVSGDTPPIIRSLKLHKDTLVLHKWKVVGRAVVGSPTTFHVCKTRGCLCSFRLLMMGGVSPKTC